MRDEIEETFLAKQHQPCHDCGSSDALSVYNDKNGNFHHSYCFSCKRQIFANNNKTKNKKVVDDCMEKKQQTIIDVSKLICLSHRHISAECMKYANCYTGMLANRPVHIYCYNNEAGQTVGQKVRFLDEKGFNIRGNISERFYLQDRVRNGNKKVVITEGELDALSIVEAQKKRGYDFNKQQISVLSIPCGAQSALKVFKAQAEWLNKTFDEILLCFDNDEAGKKALDDIIKSNLIDYDKVRTVVFELKDANDMLVNNKADGIIDAIFNAKPLPPPDSMILGDSQQMHDLLREEDNLDDYISLPFANSPLADMLGGGLFPSQVTVLTAGTGCGKSTLACEIAYHCLKTGVKTGLLMLEENIKRTAKRFCCMQLGKRMYAKTTLTLEEIEKSEHILNNAILYNHFGSVGEGLVDKIKWLANSGCKLVILDHITIALSGLQIADERKALDVLCTQLRTMVNDVSVNHPFHLIVISHIRRTDKDIEGGDGDIRLCDLRGSSQIAGLADNVLALQRNTMADKESDRCTVKLTVLKTRYGDSTGCAGNLYFDTETGRLFDESISERRRKENVAKMFATSGDINA